MGVNSDIQVVSSEEAQDVDYGSVDVLFVLALAREPSYISEIARKLMETDMPYNYDLGGVDNNVVVDSDGDPVESLDSVDSRWSGLSENKAVRTVSSIVNVVQESDEIVVTRPGYEYESDAPKGSGQKEGSPHLSFGGTGNVSEKEWRSYKIVKYEPEDGGGSIGDILEIELDGIVGKIDGVVDMATTFEDKARIVKRLSGFGNDVSKDAENIMQDSFKRQFRYYDNVEVSDYNSPGVDLYVEDEMEREWGVSFEVSVRWVNPIDKPYVEEKKDSAFDRDSDLVILAPRYTKRMVDKYEPKGDERYHSDPLNNHVHLHSVPNGSESVYRPFVTSKQGADEEDGEEGGNPVIVPDSDEIRNRIASSGHVAGGYPIVDENYGSFRRLLESHFRNYNVVSESVYRNSIREAIEPIFWEFLRPYKIEQFLIDTYWDKGLTQSEIGNLVDRSGSTIGTWMRKWGVMRRGTGAPEMSEETIEIWKRMYRGKDPFPQQFSGYRIQAEYNRHPLWSLDDWREWYQDTTSEEREEIMSSMGSYRDNLGYTIMVGANDRLLPSYTFILKTLRENGVEIRPPDEAPRVPYQAYPSKSALEYMINKDQNTIVDVSGGGGE